MRPWNRNEGRLGMDSWKSEKNIAFFGRINYTTSIPTSLPPRCAKKQHQVGKDNNGASSLASAARRLSNLPACRRVRCRRPELAGRSCHRPLRISPLQLPGPLSGFGRYLNDERRMDTVFGPPTIQFKPQWEKQNSSTLRGLCALQKRLMVFSIISPQGIRCHLLYDARAAHIHHQEFHQRATTSSSVS